MEVFSAVAIAMENKEARKRRCGRRREETMRERVGGRRGIYTRKYLKR